MYEEGWKEYRRYRRDFWIIFAGYIPVIFLAATLSNWLFHSFTPAFVAASIYILLWIVAGIRVQTFACPRCGKWFSGTWWYNWSFLARKCQHCGLRKFSQE
jgi:hypothetical protein